MKITDEKLDAAFRRLVKLTYPPVCVTCGKAMKSEEVQAGHFRVRKHYATRWDLRNVHPQCSKCNVENCGEVEKHAAWIDSYHGAGTADELTRMSNQVVKMGLVERAELLELLEKESVLRGA